MHSPLPPPVRAHLQLSSAGRPVSTYMPEIFSRAGAEVTHLTHIFMFGEGGDFPARSPFTAHVARSFGAWLEKNNVTALDQVTPAHAEAYRAIRAGDTSSLYARHLRRLFASFKEAGQIAENPFIDPRARRMRKPPRLSLRAPGHPKDLGIPQIFFRAGWGALNATRTFMFGQTPWLEKKGRPEATAVRNLALWLDAHQISYLGQVTAPVAETYLASLAPQTAIKYAGFFRRLFTEYARRHVIDENPFIDRRKNKEPGRKTALPASAAVVSVSPPRKGKDEAEALAGKMNERQQQRAALRAAMAANSGLPCDSAYFLAIFVRYIEKNKLNARPLSSATPLNRQLRTGRRLLGFMCWKSCAASGAVIDLSGPARVSPEFAHKYNNGALGQWAEQVLTERRRMAKSSAVAAFALAPFKEARRPLAAPSSSGAALPGVR